MSSLLSVFVYSGTIFASAFSLFLVQPIIAKQILPWFGGTAAVWAICMVFFQVTLLAGYAYSDWMARRVSPRRQVWTHLILLALSLSFLPIAASAAWKPTGTDDPMWMILGLLAATIGLPYFVLSTTGPLLQSWLAKVSPDRRIYRLFSLSNIASLIALLCYPFLIETTSSLGQQVNGWSVGYAVFVLLCAGAALLFLRDGAAQATTPHAASEATLAPPSWRQALVWLAPAALASWLLLAITNHITQNVASVPFLWLAPLVLYLLTFILCFESDRWYRRGFWAPFAGVMLALCAYGLQDSDVGVTVKVAVPVYTVGLFALCMFLHGELSAIRPQARHLTQYYLMISLGGAIGGVFVGLVAPRVLPAYYELGIGLLLTAAFAAVRFRQHKAAVLASLVILTLSGVFFSRQVIEDVADSRTMERSFYGTLATVDDTDDELGDRVRKLFHGSVKHGEQYLSDARRREPTTYYGRSSGVGLAIEQSMVRPMHIGVVGLGAGTLAAYGRAGDTFRMYEINPQVIDIAHKEFTFLADTPSKVDMVLGDARVAMEREAPQAFDVLAIDAFSGDSIPMHLLTAQAMQIYLRHIRPDGIIAFHLTNRFLWLPPVVEKIAQAAGLSAKLIHDATDSPLLRDTDWVLVAKDPAVLEQSGIRMRSVPIRPIPGLKVWTDDTHNLFDVLR